MGGEGCVQLGKCLLKLYDFIFGGNLWSTLYQKRPMSVLQALRIAASWRLTPFRRIPYQLFLVPDFYRCFGINSMNINKSQVLHHMFNFVVPSSRQGGIMIIWKPERFHCHTNWVHLKIELPPNGVVSYQACQRVVFFRWHVGLSEADWNYCWHEQEQILKKSSYNPVIFSPSYE